MSNRPRYFNDNAYIDYVTSRKKVNLFIYGHT